MGGKIQRSRTVVADNMGSGRLLNVTCDSVKEKINQRIRDNLKISTDNTLSGNIKSY
jgi:hypothetical protein